MKCKRLLSSLLAGVMVIAACTCGSSAAGPIPEGPGGPPAAVYIQKLTAGGISAGYTAEEYLARNASWLRYENGKASITSLDDFVSNYLGRMKACTAFDNLDCAEAENEEMGTASVNAMHFNSAVAGLIAQLKDSHPEEYAKYYDGYAAVAGDMNLAERVYLINPMNYTGTSEVCDTAPFFRIRVGTADGHTAFTVSMNLALKLAATENTLVDYAMIWDEPHGDADYAGELFAWIDQIWTAPAAVDAPSAPAADVPGASSTYVVQKGDSLWGIAARLLGSGARWGEIYEANRAVVHDPAQLQIGMVLTIPQ